MDKVTGIAKTKITTETIAAALFLDIFKFSIKAAVGTSTILIEDVNAAKNNKTKNNTAKTFP